MIRATPALCALILFTASGAEAAQVTRTDVQGASGMCRAATTAYDTAGVRYRPLGLTNIAPEAVFVTCTWQGDDAQYSVRGATRLAVRVFNEGAQRNLACTLVNGHRSGGTTFATYTTKTVTIPAGGTVEMQWLPGDIAGSPATINLPSLSCELPNNMTLQYTTKVYAEDVGA